MRTVFDRSEWTKGLLAGACIGSAIGAILALLYAPTSGKELRLKARERTDKMLTEAADIIEKAKARTSEAVRDAKKKLIEEETSLKSAVKAGVDAYKEELAHS